jgi:Flp pilus assembly protein CpaB
LAFLAFLALALGLLQVLPQTQAVVHATRDLAPGTVVGPGDVAVAQVHLPSDLATATIASTDQVVGRRLEAPVAAGELLAPAQFAAQHAVVARGRLQPTIAVDSASANGGQLGRGDLVRVFGSPRQTTTSNGAADILVERARVIEVRTPEGAGNAIAGTGRPLLLTLDVTQDEAARLLYASHADALDVVLVGTDGVDP